LERRFFVRFWQAAFLDKAMQPKPPSPQDEPRAPADRKAQAVCDQVGKFLGFVVNETSEELSEISTANKQRICDEIQRDVLENVGRPEPVLAVRRRLTNYATLAVRDEVLTLTPAETVVLGISGNLRPRIPDLAKRIPAIGEFLGKRAAEPATVGQMADLLRARGIVFNLWARAYNVARMELGDWDRDRARDWFAPYKVVQAIISEYNYRKELGMPSNIPSPYALTEGSGELVVYAEFHKLVLEGHALPRLAWEERWESVLKYPSPLKGMEF
jgi:hypothetical protein